MSALCTQDDYKRAIRDLLKEAETSLEKDLIFEKTNFSK